MSKAPHDVDIEVHEAARHGRFVVSLFRGPGQGYHKSTEITSLEQARLGGRILQRLYSSPRLAIVYAITPDGKSVMVPPTYDPAMMEIAMLQTSTRRPSLSALATAITANGGGSPGALADQAGAALPKSELRKIADAAAKTTPITKITSTIEDRNKVLATIPKPTPAPDAGKASTDVDLGDIPVHLRRGTPENAAFLSPENEAKGRAVVAAKTAAAKPAKAPEKPLVSESVRKAISAAKPAKAKKEKAKRAESPDAVKPIVPHGGAALTWWNDLEAKALKGQLPPVPDFSADTHASYRERLKAVVTLAKAGDIAALKKNDVRPLWNSQTQIVRYRELCLIALHAKAGKPYRVEGDMRNDKDTRVTATSTKPPAKTSAKKAVKASSTKGKTSAKKKAGQTKKRRAKK